MDENPSLEGDKGTLAISLPNAQALPPRREDGMDRTSHPPPGAPHIPSGGLEERLPALGWVWPPHYQSPPDQRLDKAASSLPATGLETCELEDVKIDHWQTMVRLEGHPLHFVMGPMSHHALVIDC